MIDPPDYSALINPIAMNAFAMRYIGRRDFVQSLAIDTGGPNSISKITFNLFDGEFDNLPVTDALMFISPFVKLTTAVDPQFAAEMLVSRLTVLLEGETVVDKELLERFLVLPPFQSADSAGMPGRVYVGRNEDALIGNCRLHFTCKKPTIRMTIEGFPGGGGPMHLIYGAVLAHYTTKSKTGVLYEVGTLDQNQQCLPVSHQWSKTQKDAVTEDKLERTYGNVLRNLIDQKEMEIRRLKEDAELKAKAEKKAADETILARMISKTEDLADKIVTEGRVTNLKPPPSETDTPSMKDIRPIIDIPIDFDAALARAKSRLIRWGITATIVLVAVALFIKFVLKP